MNGQAPTETAAGFKDYYACNCGKCCEDAEGTTEITDLSSRKAQGGNGYLPSDNELAAAKNAAITAIQQTQTIERESALQTGDNGYLTLVLLFLALSSVGVYAYPALKKREKMNNRI